MSLRLGLSGSLSNQPEYEKTLKLWESLSPADLGEDADNHSDIEEGVFRDSVVRDFWTKGTGSQSNGAGHGRVENIIVRLKSLPHLQSLLESLGEQLLSNRSEDDISGYLVDLVGMNDLDLVTEVLSNRNDVGTALVGGSSAIVSNNNSTSKQKRYKKIDQELDEGRVNFTAEEARMRMEENLRANEERPLFTGVAITDGPTYTHVYTSSSNVHGNILSMFGSKFTLPLGTQRNTYEQYQEVIIPPANTVPPRINERLVPVQELDPLAGGCFPGYKSLNRIQSIVYPTAYTTNENMLVCAPTGAGKTDVAMLTILRVLDQHTSNKANPQDIDRNAFKIIYVAPMKALAAEIVRKFSRRLKWLAIKVRELTGDMQLTKQEIDETQIIVTTPEKWDVVTRKPTGEGELATKIKLLIIDEIHLLNDERGAVIETIIARTLRQVESSQSVIRVVGLSATLPNFVDVAEFVGANLERGLFYFDSSFRPVPLEQHFLGIKGKLGSPQARKNLDEVTFEKVSELVREGHQVMVFVHARKDTVKAALALKEAATQDDSLDQFSCMDHPQFQFFRREIASSRNKEMKQLFDDGFGIHHAGMLRTDRNMMERMFEARAIKVLCCTATLAWGVNLPAHAVIIKGTQVYDSNRGTFVDLSVLDVLQIFGRAGRPGMESSGVGYICTGEDKLEHYLGAITSQLPIESKLVSGIVDSLNAEIALGTVSNIQEAVSWLGYTYLHVRMRKNPFHYGITRDMLQDDPQLVGRRNELATSAARKLSDAGMISFNVKTEELAINDLGLIAAKYYIRHASIEVYNQMFKPKMSESDLLVMLSKSTEFSQIQVRENEISELETVMRDKELVPCQIPEPLKEDTANRRIGIDGGEKARGKGGGDKNGTERKPSPVDTTDGKVNVLLQGYISKYNPQDFALVSDMAYVAQNGGRIIRALLEVAISRKYASTAASLAQMSLAVEKRMWPFVNPMEQFTGELRADVIHNLTRWADQYTPAELAQYSAQALGELIHMNRDHGAALLRAAKQFPSAELSVRVRPLTAELLKIQVTATRKFEWGKRHESREPFWLWVQDEEGSKILQFTRVTFLSSRGPMSTQSRDQAPAQGQSQNKSHDQAQVSTNQSYKGGPAKGQWTFGSSSALRSEFTIPLQAVTGPSKSISVCLISDRWLGAVEEATVSLQDVAFPAPGAPSTPVLSLPFLPLTVLSNLQLEVGLQDWGIQVFNGMQTQVFYALVQTAQNVLLAGPTANGKSALVLATVCKICTTSSPGVLMFVPRKRDALQVVSSLRELGANASLAGTKSLQFSQAGRIQVITPSKFLEWVCDTRQSLHKSAYIRSLGTIVYESLESLDSEYELAITLIRHAAQTLPIRFLAVSSSLTDTADLASWLGVPPRGHYSFRPSDREQELTSSTHSFSIPHSSALLRAMAKPTYSSLRAIATEESGIVFVPAQGLCQNVVNDLVRLCGSDFNALGFLGGGITPDGMEPIVERLENPELADGLAHGIGIYHHRMSERDQQLVLELYSEGTVRVLVAPREACWSIPVRAARVIVMGTQYLQIGPGGANRELKNYTLGEVARMQSQAVRSGRPGSFVLMCQGEDRDTYMRFLREGLPLESELMEGDHEVLAEWIKGMAGAGLLQSPQDMMDIMGHTYLRRRLKSNPNYYSDEDDGRDILSKLVDSVWPKGGP
ncbi:hypothetical protein RhiJN_00736 [Ceratobasidium sp. AG-Ba]|nr:hypothetical protein RhiJN_00736 [Ceratobasidium sp. AG-Ba]QRW01772.1 hypothetical protein RhiLY_00769 [Ceratobasidium sp. AG-Ba]